MKEQVSRIDPRTLAVVLSNKLIEAKKVDAPEMHLQAINELASAIANVSGVAQALSELQADG